MIKQKNLYGPPAQRASEVSDWGLDNAQRAQHQNAPSIPEAGPQES